jgi:hypothetical protein
MITVPAQRAPSQPKSPRKPRPRPIETYHLLHCDHATVLYILQGKDSYRYVIEPVPCEIGGTAFRLSKQWGVAVEETYHVRLSCEGDTCDCKGGCYVGRCKHVAALAHFVASGQLAERSVA